MNLYFYSAIVLFVALIIMLYAIIITLYKKNKLIKETQNNELKIVNNISFDEINFEEEKHYEKKNYIL